MTNKELKYLEDIFNVISDMEVSIGTDRKFENFNNNKTLRYAVERQFEIIGEAAKNFKNLNKEIEISNVKEIIGLRNLIAHAYDSVDYEKLWAIVINHIPKLKIEIEQLIKKYE